MQDPQHTDETADTDADAGCTDEPTDGHSDDSATDESDVLTDADPLLPEVEQ